MYLNPPTSMPQEEEQNRTKKRKRYHQENVGQSKFICNVGRCECSISEQDTHSDVPRNSSGSTVLQNKIYLKVLACSMIKDVGYRGKVQETALAAATGSYRNLELLKLSLQKATVSNQDCLLNLRANQLFRFSPAPGLCCT